MLRIVNSPFGRVLQAIRENEFRAEALGYRTVLYRTVPACCRPDSPRLAGAHAGAAGCATTGRTPRCRSRIMVDILLMVVIGGMGTLYGSVLGATLFVMAQNYLQDVLGRHRGRGAGLPLLRGPVASRTAGCCGWGSCSS